MMVGSRFQEVKKWPLSNIECVFLFRQSAQSNLFDNQIDFFVLVMQLDMVQVD